MVLAFYVSSGIAVISTVAMLTRLRVIHSLLYLVISMLAIAVMFYTLGAPFVAALEAIVYAGAIMVLFVFMTMTLNLNDETLENSNVWMGFKCWVCPIVLIGALLAEFIYTAIAAVRQPVTGPIVQHVVEPEQVGLVLFGPWLLGVELVSMLLLAGIIGAYRLGWIPPDVLPPVRETISEEERKEPVRELTPARERAMGGRDLVHTGSRRSGDAT
jgi:NADH-quinone oxidoreductase subunit J